MNKTYSVLQLCLYKKAKPAVEHTDRSAVEAGIHCPESICKHLLYYCMNTSPIDETVLTGNAPAISPHCLIRFNSPQVDGAMRGGTKTA